MSREKSGPTKSASPPLESGVPTLKEKFPDGQIIMLRWLATALMAIGLVTMVTGLRPGGLEQIAAGIGSLVASAVLRALAGIWLACEVTARR